MERLHGSDISTSMRAVKIGRFTAGFLAALVAAPVTVVAAIIDVRMTRRLHWDAMGALFLAIAVGVLWLGEEYGVIAEPYRNGKDDPLSLK